MSKMTPSVESVMTFLLRQVPRETLGGSDVRGRGGGPGRARAGSGGAAGAVGLEPGSLLSFLNTVLKLGF